MIGMQVLGAYDAPGAATFAVRGVVAVAYISGNTCFCDFGRIHELTYSPSRGAPHHGRSITAARTSGANAQLHFYTRQVATMGQRFRTVGDEKFALDERGRDVLSFSETDVQSFEPVSIQLVLCEVPMIEVTFGDEQRWVADESAHFLVEFALAGLGDGLDVDDAMSAAAAAAAQREAASECDAPRKQRPPQPKAPRLMPKIIPTKRVKVISGKHEGRKGTTMAQRRGGWWRVKAPVLGDGDVDPSGAEEIISVQRGDLALDSA